MGDWGEQRNGVGSLRELLNTEERRSGGAEDFWGELLKVEGALRELPNTEVRGDGVAEDF